MGELLDDHSNVRKTHGWWWFSGQNIEPGWAFWAGTGGVRISYGMEDAVDGGYQIIMTNGHIGTMDAENTRQYNHNGAVMLGVCKRASTNGKFGLGFLAMTSEFFYEISQGGVIGGENLPPLPGIVLWVIITLWVLVAGTATYTGLIKSET